MGTGKISRHKLKLAGYATLCFVGAGMIVAWFAWIAPLQRSVLHDMLVCDGQNNATWWETHRRGAQILWQHDDFVTVGENASKEDVPWIITKGSEGHEFDSCSDGHKATALSIMTNQNAGETKEVWQKWWENHKHETQAQWILKGFEDSGLKVTLPLNHETAIALLTKIGHGTFSSIADSHHHEITRHLRSNALRLLRDLDFKPGEITAPEIAADSTGDLLKGLLEYQSWRDAHPLENGVGVVFAEPSVVRPARSTFMLTALPWIWWIVAGACLVGGIKGLRTGGR